MGAMMSGAEQRNWTSDGSAAGGAGQGLGPQLGDRRQCCWWCRAGLGPQLGDRRRTRGATDGAGRGRPPHGVESRLAGHRFRPDGLQGPSL